MVKVFLNLKVKVLCSLPIFLKILSIENYEIKYTGTKKIGYGRTALMEHA